MIDEEVKIAKYRVLDSMENSTYWNFVALDYISVLQKKGSMQGFTTETFIIYQELDFQIYCSKLCLAM